MSMGGLSNAYQNAAVAAARTPHTNSTYSPNKCNVICALSEARERYCNKSSTPHDAHFNNVVNDTMILLVLQSKLEMTREREIYSGRRKNQNPLTHTLVHLSINLRQFYFLNIRKLLDLRMKLLSSVTFPVQNSNDSLNSPLKWHFN